MQHQLLNDRKRGERHGNADSELNLKLRRSMFNIVFGMCNPFLPDPIPDDFRLWLPDRYHISTSTLEMGAVLIEVKFYNEDAKFIDICAWWNYNGKIRVRDNPMLSYDVATIVAKHVSSGWPLRMVEQLKRNRRRKEAAMELSEALDLPL